jgi:hypothetical protein
MIMRAFVKMRQLLATHKELANKLAELEKHLQRHDVEIFSIVEAIRELTKIETKPSKKIGFLTDK